MAIETYTTANLILWLTPVRCTSIASGIGIDTGLQALAVDIIHKATQSVRETCGVNEQVTLGITATKETVVDVYVVITAILETELHHSIGLSLDYRIIDLETIGIPRTPAHERGIVGRRTKRQRQRQSTK